MLKFFSQVMFVFLWHVAGPAYTRISTRLGFQGIGIGNKHVHWFGSGFGFFGFSVHVSAGTINQSLCEVSYFFPRSSRRAKARVVNVAVPGTRSSRAVATALPPF